MTGGLVVIVDSGLRGPGGHNLSYTGAVRREFVRRGFEVEVFVNRGCPPDLAEADGFRRLFTGGAYDHPLGHGKLRDLVYLNAQALVFCEELEHGLRCTLKRPVDLVFTHTVADFELVGWRHYARRGILPGHLAVLLRQTPRYSTVGAFRRRLNPYWRLRPSCFAALSSRMGRRFTLCTDSALLSRDYARVYRGALLTLPIPLTSEVRETPGAPRTSPAAPIVGYLGDARSAKGFHLLPGAVDAVQAAGLVARFVVQCPVPSGDRDEKVVAALAALGARPEIELIPRHLGDAEYAGLLERLDVVLLPYIHANYLEATSGVFTEALARGKPVVVPSGGWMAHALADSGAGLEFDRQRPEGLPRVLSELLRRLSEYQAAARRHAKAWRAYHTPEALVDKLLTATLESGRVGQTHS